MTDLLRPKTGAIVWARPFRCGVCSTSSENLMVAVLVRQGDIANKADGIGRYLLNLAFRSRIALVCEDCTRASRWPREDCAHNTIKPGEFVPGAVLNVRIDPSETIVRQIGRS